MKKIKIERNVNGELKTFILTPEEIDFIIKENEMENLIEDILSFIRENNKLSKKDEELIHNDKHLIQKAYDHKMDCALSYWENIEKTIDYLKDCETNFNYSKLREV